MPPPRLTYHLPVGTSPHARDYPLAALCTPDGTVYAHRDGGATPAQRRAWAAGLRQLADSLAVRKPVRGDTEASTEPDPADAP